MISSTNLATAAEYVPGGGPLRAQVFAHIERTGHFVSIQFSGETIRKRRAVYFTDVARDPNVVARNRSGEIARGEIALMSSSQLIALLLHVESVVAASSGKFDVHVPPAGKIAHRGFGCLRRSRRPFGGEDLIEPVADDLVLARRHHVCGDGDTGFVGSARASAAASPTAAAQ